jgi:hypothetical protein
MYLVFVFLLFLACVCIRSLCLIVLIDSCICSALFLIRSSIFLSFYSFSLYSCRIYLVVWFGISVISNIVYVFIVVSSRSAIVLVFLISDRMSLLFFLLFLAYIRIRSLCIVLIRFDIWYVGMRLLVQFSIPSFCL